jgi:hypothetical protein
LGKFIFSATNVQKGQAGGAASGEPQPGAPPK